MKNDSSQGVMQQWVRVTTQSLDAGLCNEWWELDVGGGGQYGRLLFLFYCRYVLLLQLISVVSLAREILGNQTLGAPVK